MNFKTLLVVFLIFALMTPFLEASRKKHSKGKKAVKMHHDYALTDSDCRAACTNYSGYTSCGVFSQSCCPETNCTGSWYSGYYCATGTALDLSC